jgi:hypothetical protein
VLGDDQARRAMQIQRPAIVAQPLPSPKHVSHGRPGKGAYVGEEAGEELVLARDTWHLGLLQHDFRNEDEVGVGSPAPREIATVHPVMVPDRGAEVRKRLMAWGDDRALACIQ